MKYLIIAVITSLILSARCLGAEDQNKDQKDLNGLARDIINAIRADDPNKLAGELNKFIELSKEIKEEEGQDKNTLANRPFNLAEKLNQLKERHATNKPGNSRIIEEGIKDLKDEGISNKALKLNASAPDVNLSIPPDEEFPAEMIVKTSSGDVVPLKKIYETGPVVLTFYRGGWCPYCMLELQAYEALLDRFENLGAHVVAIAPDKYREIQKTKKKFGITFGIFSDPDNKIAKKFGLAFKVDSDTLELYKEFGIDLQKAQGNSANELPMPGTYVIDRKGKIRFAFVDPDYRKRAEPMKVLNVVKQINK